MLIIQIPITHHQYTDGRDSVATFGRTIGDALWNLCGPHPQMKKELFDSENKLFPTMQISVNGTIIRNNTLEFTIKDGDEIELSFVVSEG